MKLTKDEFFVFMHKLGLSEISRETGLSVKPGAVTPFTSNLDVKSVFPYMTLPPGGTYSEIIIRSKKLQQLRHYKIVVPEHDGADAYTFFAWLYQVLHKVYEAGLGVSQCDNSNYISCRTDFELCRVVTYASPIDGRPITDPSRVRRRDVSLKHCVFAELRKMGLRHCFTINQLSVHETARSNPTAAYYLMMRREYLRFAKFVGQNNMRAIVGPRSTRAR